MSQCPVWAVIAAVGVIRVLIFVSIQKMEACCNIRLIMDSKVLSINGWWVISMVSSANCNTHSQYLVLTITFHMSVRCDNVTVDALNDIHVSSRSRSRVRSLRSTLSLPI